MDALERLFLRRFRGVDTLGAVPSSSDADEFDADRFSGRFSDISLKAGVAGGQGSVREGGSQGLGFRSSSVTGGAAGGDSLSGGVSPLGDSSSSSSGEIVDRELQVFPDSVARWLNATAARMVACGESVRCVEAYR